MRTKKAGYWKSDCAWRWAKCAAAFVRQSFVANRADETEHAAAADSESAETRANSLRVATRETKIGAFQFFFSVGANVIRAQTGTNSRITTAQTQRNGRSPSHRIKFKIGRETRPILILGKWSLCIIQLSNWKRVPFKAAAAAQEGDEEEMIRHSIGVDELLKPMRHTH